MHFIVCVRAKRVNRADSRSFFCAFAIRRACRVIMSSSRTAAAATPGLNTYESLSDDIIRLSIFFLHLCLETSFLISSTRLLHLAVQLAVALVEQLYYRRLSSSAAAVECILNKSIIKQEMQTALQNRLFSLSPVSSLLDMSDN